MNRDVRRAWSYDMRVYVNPVLPVKSDGRRISVAHTQFRLVGVVSMLAKRWVVLMQCVGAGVGRDRL